MTSHRRTELANAAANLVSVPRSYLFVPGNRPERFGKACAAGADRVILDLEDAVPASEKSTARAAIVAWLSPMQAVLIRINGAHTEWFREDIELCRLRGVAGVVLPKAEQVEHIQQVAEQVGVDKQILPLIESARGFTNAIALARAQQVCRLIFGTIDFQLDLGITGEGEELTYFRSQLVLLSRLAEVASPVDGVSTAIEDMTVVKADAMRAKRLGFGAKLCIHPKQVPIVNDCFNPTEDEIAWAKRVVAAAAAAQGAAVAVNGHMVDRPVLARARAILATHSDQHATIDAQVP